MNMVLIQKSFILKIDIIQFIKNNYISKKFKKAQVKAQASDQVDDQADNLLKILKFCKNEKGLERLEK